MCVTLESCDGKNRDIFDVLVAPHLSVEKTLHSHPPAHTHTHTRILSHTDYSAKSPRITSTSREYCQNLGSFVAYRPCSCCVCEKSNQTSLRAHTRMHAHTRRATMTPRISEYTLKHTHFRSDLNSLITSCSKEYCYINTHS